MAKNIVTVGCKLPNGLEIHLGDNREKVVVLKGANSSDLIGGHGLTEVDAEFWAAWLEQNTDFAPLQAGLIFANESAAKARDEAKEKVDNASGFEGINPEKPGKDIKKATDKDDE